MLKNRRKMYIGKILFLVVLMSFFVNNNISFAGTNGYTRNGAVQYVNSWVGTGYDVDHSGKYDCVDLAKKYFLDIGGMAYTVVIGNAAGYASSANAIPFGWRREYISEGYYPQPGDVAVWGKSYSQYGHVAIIISVDSNADTFKCVEQSTGKNVPAYYSKNYSIYGPVCYIVPDFDLNPPTYAVLNINHTRFTSNQSVSLTYSSDTATDYFLHVFYKGGNEIECVQVSSSGTDTYQFASTGEYTLYIGASNQSGAVASNSVDLTVVDARRPSVAELAAIAPICEAGTYARFTYHSDTATYYYLHVLDANLKEIECVEAPASGRGAYLLSNPGKYSFYVGVANNYGDLASNLVTVNCLPSIAPKTAELQTTKTAIKGSPFAIHYTSDTAVEFYLHVFDASKQEIECISLSSTGSDEYIFENAGLYTLYVGVANSKGVIASNSIDVVVLSSEENVFSLPSGIVLIDVSAFEGCAAKRIILPEGTRTIEDYAFSNCSKLELIEIPETVEVIGEHAFYGSDNVVIAAPVGSYAYEYAQEHGIACARR